MTLRLITAPAAEPISLADAKLQCRVSGSGEDALINLYIKAARLRCEALTESALITQTWESVLDAFPTSGGALELRRPPVVSVTSVKYVAADTGTLTTLDPGAYTADIVTYPGWVLPVDSWPATADQANAVQARFVCGYGPAATDVPEDLRAWMLLTIAQMYAQREAADMTGKSTAQPGRFYDSLLDPYRNYSL